MNRATVKLEPAERIPADFEDHMTGLERFAAALRGPPPVDPAVRQWRQRAQAALHAYIDALGPALRPPISYERLLELRLTFTAELAGAHGELLSATVGDAMLRKAIRAMGAEASKLRQGVLRAAVLALRALGPKAKPADCWRWLEKQKVVTADGYKVAVIDGDKIRQTKPGGKSYAPITKRQLIEAYLPRARAELAESRTIKDRTAKKPKK
jgi:hypothetical protein